MAGSGTLTINKKEVRRFMLDAALQKWPSGKMRRFSGESIYPQADAALKKWMRDYIAQHPTVGHTIK